MNYIVCVDLGSINDYNTIGIIELTGGYLEDDKIDEQRHTKKILTFVSKYELRQLERMPIGTTYPELVTRIKNLMSSSELFNNSELVVDATGVGVAVLQQMYNESLTPFGVTITGGATVGRNTLGYTVPKVDLISTLQLIFQSKRLKISKGIKHGPELVHEVRNFKITNKGNRDKMEAWRESDHDDLVLCLAIGLWYGERILGGNTTVEIDDKYDDYDPLWDGMR